VLALTVESAFYIWLYFLGVAICHDQMKWAYHPQGRRLRRLYLFLPAIKHRARQRRKKESDETKTKK